VCQGRASAERSEGSLDMRKRSRIMGHRSATGGLVRRVAGVVKGRSALGSVKAPLRGPCGLRP
jgi:hypothetical protein